MLGPQWGRQFLAHQDRDGQSHSEWPHAGSVLGLLPSQSGVSLACSLQTDSYGLLRGQENFRCVKAAAEEEEDHQKSQAGT